MSENADRLRGFFAYAQSLDGDERGEAQVFVDRFFQAFGHAGYKEAGATLESRIRRRGAATRFVDLLWRPRVLIEMKKRGERLERHYAQAFDYWVQSVPDRPQYVVLCNFDEIWIYDFDVQLYEPLDRVVLKDLPHRYPALNFMFPKAEKPQFGNNLVDVTREAADRVASVFRHLVARGEDRERAQRFVLQCVVAMFAEDIDLMPRGLFTGLVDDCRAGTSSYDLLGGLFRQMNSQRPARAGRYAGVPYFNGGIFSIIDPVELNTDEIELLRLAAQERWDRVQPHIFGTLFEGSMDAAERHAFGAHFTSEADIQRVVGPSMIRPLRERLAAAKSGRDVIALRDHLTRLQVLDPACGSGNFLYMAYRELKRLEAEVLNKMYAEFGRRIRKVAGDHSRVSTRQFHGIEIKPFGAELAKVTLMLAKKLAIDEMQALLDTGQLSLPIDWTGDALPLDNLDANVRCEDALFTPWPRADVVIGNPPYQSKNKMQEEFGRAYVNRVRAASPDIPGHADYCVYWFRKAHDHLAPGGRAGLVGTKTIRQTNSRRGGLDYIVENGGTIVEAVRNQVWSGEANVHVAIVNWVRGSQRGPKVLYEQTGDRRDSPWRKDTLPVIPSSLSAAFDVSQAADLQANKTPKVCYQGQTHGHEAFLITPEEAADYVRRSKKVAEVLFPYLIGDELIGTPDSRPRRYAIDFQPRSQVEAAAYGDAYARIKKHVLPARQEALKKETERNEEALEDDPKAKTNAHHEKFLNAWWLFSWPREDLIATLQELSRYIACSRVTKRPIFEFVSTSIRPNDALQVFALEDDYSFGILQSGIHWKWFMERCSGLKRDPRYTSTTVFDSFPWPQKPSLASTQGVAEAGRELRRRRRELMAKSGLNLRDLYRTLELPGRNPLRDASEALDAAVMKAYGMPRGADTLRFLSELNRDVAAAEAKGLTLTGPGLPGNVRSRAAFVSKDCVRLDLR